MRRKEVILMYSILHKQGEGGYPDVTRFDEPPDTPTVVIFSTINPNPLAIVNSWTTPVPSKLTLSTCALISTQNCVTGSAKLTLSPNAGTPFGIQCNGLDQFPFSTAV